MVKNTNAKKIQNHTNSNESRSQSLQENLVFSRHGPTMGSRQRSTEQINSRIKSRRDKPIHNESRIHTRIDKKTNSAVGRQTRREARQDER